MAQMPAPFWGPFLADVREMRRHWGWLLGAGLVMIALGVVAVFHTVLASLISVIVLGWVLAFSGVAQGAYAFWARHWGGFFLHLLGGILSLVVGLLMVVNPLVGAVSLALLMAAYFTASGLIRIAGALTLGFEHWGWTLLNGAITFALGLLIWAQWPASGLWIIGLFIGIDLLMTGWTLVMLSVAIHRLPIAREA